MKVMTDAQPNQGWQGGQRSIGTGEGESPLAVPTQNVTARTMTSDLASMQSSGGGQPRPYVPPPTPPQPAPVRPPIIPAQQFVPSRPIQPPQPAAPLVRPSVPTPPQKLTNPVVPPQRPAPKKKGVLVALVIAIILVALAALGYFVVFPLMNQPVAEGPAAVTPAPETPVPPTPEPPAQPAAPTGGVVQHVSFFTSPADMTDTIVLSEVSLPVLKNSFVFDTAEVPILREVTFANTQGQPVPAAALANLIDPTTFAPSVMDRLSADATFFTFTNTHGTWLGMVLEARDAASLPTLAMTTQAIEDGHSLANYFLLDPGTPGIWKSGQASGLATRYLSFAQSGAALNYGWLGSKLVISASYDGLKAALSRLQ